MLLEQFKGNSVSSVSSYFCQGSTQKRKLVESQSKLSASVAALLISLNINEMTNASPSSRNLRGVGAADDQLGQESCHHIKCDWHTCLLHSIHSALFLRLQNVFLILIFYQILHFVQKKETRRRCFSKRP